MRTKAAWILLVATAIPAQAQPPAQAPGQDWWNRAPTYRSKYYTIKTDIAPEEAKPLCEHMDATFESYWGLFTKLPIRLQRPASLDLYLFASQDDYMKVLKQRFHDDGTGSWGKCITFGNRISVVGWRGKDSGKDSGKDKYSNEEMKLLLQHEGFHQVASHLFTGLPRWANEGLAEFFERGVVVERQLALGEVPAFDRERLLKAVEERKTLPLDRLFSVDGKLWSEQVRASDADSLYLQSWSLVHFLVLADQGKYESGFLSFLVQLNRNVEWRKAFVAAFGMPDFQALETKWLEYVRSRPPTNYRETVCRLKFLAAGMTELHKQGRRPASIAELRQQLQEIKFECEIDLFGKARKLSAADARVFEVPLADGIPERKFVLVEPRGATAGKTAQSTPPTIVAEGQDPQVFTAQWLRRGREAGYTISAAPATPRKKAR